MAKESTVLVYGTNLGGYRAAYALCKKGYRVVLLNRGSYVDEMRNQALSQLPFDFCWICGHMPQRLFKALGGLEDNYNAELLQISGRAGSFKVKFKKKDQIVNNFACIECDKCIEVCPVEVGERKAIWVHPEVAWENIYLIDFEHCTKCGKCEEVCPTHALKVERPEEIREVDVGAIILAPEFDEPTEEDLKDFGLGESMNVIKNSEIARRSLLTNFVQDSVRLPSGKIPQKFGIIVTPHFNKPGMEYENYNLCVSALYRGVRLKEILPESEVTVFLHDYRGFGKGHYRWYEKALNMGVRIERVERLKVISGTNKEPVIQYEKGDKTYNLPVELAILVTGQKPPRLMENLSRICGVKSDDNGFCHIRRFSSTETDVDGIFAVGEFTAPKGNPETIWEGCAALTEILKYLGEPNFKPSPPPPLRDLGGQEPKVGVFICSCFGQFNERMDLKSLKEEVKKIPGVSHAEIIQGCCTPPTIKETADKIAKSGVNRVVLAVCTPLQKLLKYRKAVMTAGLNPLLCEFLRLREDVINVHRDKQKMLIKALALIRSGVEKVKRGSQSPTRADSFIPRALVIGAGASGLTAAYEIASNGHSVSVVEKEERLGGKIEYLDEEEKEYVKDLIAKIEDNPNITVYKGAEVEQVTGYAGNFHVRVKTEKEELTLDAGVIILATGAEEYKPEGFLYGEDSRVITQRELADRLTTNEFPGPSTVFMIQCVGSRNEEHPYCSRVCCNQALKNAIALRKKGAEVTILYRDITCYGKENLYEKAMESGVRFLRFDEKKYPEVSKTGDGIEVTTTDGMKERVDLVVLSTGIVPDEGNNKNLASILGYPLDVDGFFSSDVSVYPYEEAIKKLTKPFELATNGIYPVGLAHSPRAFDESILTAKDAAGRALVMLGKGKIPSPNAMYVAEVKESLCMGCGLCVDACPYSARYIDEMKKLAVVYPFLCDSCGSCVAICPNDASYLTDFKGNQAIAALDALLI